MTEGIEYGDSAEVEEPPPAATTARDLVPGPTTEQHVNHPNPTVIAIGLVHAFSLPLPKKKIKLTHYRMQSNICVERTGKVDAIPPDIPRSIEVKRIARG